MGRRAHIDRTRAIATGAPGHGEHRSCRAPGIEHTCRWTFDRATRARPATDSIEILWGSQSANPITHFRIGHNTLGSWFSTQRPASKRSIIFNNLTHNTGYRFWIEAHNSDGASEKVYVSVSTLSLGPPPAAPTNLRICGAQFLEFCIGGGTQLNWRDNANDETRYEFEWIQARAGVPPWQAAYITVDLPANRRWHSMNLQSGSLYHFRVRACSAAGCSAYSNNVTYGVP